jgi:hypothetical protein
MRTASTSSVWITESSQGMQAAYGVVGAIVGGAFIFGSRIQSLEQTTSTAALFLGLPDRRPSGLGRRAPRLLLGAQRQLQGSRQPVLLLPLHCRSTIRSIPDLHFSCFGTMDSNKKGPPGQAAWSCLTNTNRPIQAVPSWAVAGLHLRHHVGCLPWGSSHRHLETGLQSPMRRTHQQERGTCSIVVPSFVTTLSPIASLCTVAGFVGGNRDGSLSQTGQPR